MVSNKRLVEPFLSSNRMSVFGFLNAFTMDDFLLHLAMIQLKGTSVACLAFGGKNRKNEKKAAMLSHYFGHFN